MLLQLNQNEQAVLNYLESANRPVTLAEAAKHCFPTKRTAQANSWVRNSLRRLRDKTGLVTRLDRGTYVASVDATPTVVEVVAPKINLADPHYRTIIRSAVVRTGHRAFTEEDLNDLVQDVYAKLLTRLDRFDPARSTVTTFLFTVAKNLTLDAMRTKARRPQTEPLDDVVAVDDEAAFERILRNEQEESIREAIGQLSEAEQLFAAEFLSDTFDLGAYAKRHSITADAVYLRKFRLTQKLRQLLCNRSAA
jgi:RNA polymerase sigma-70 factor (ECF subfamily)